MIIVNKLRALRAFVSFVIALYHNLLMAYLERNLLHDMSLKNIHPLNRDSSFQCLLVFTCASYVVQI